MYLELGGAFLEYDRASPKILIIHGKADTMAEVESARYIVDHIGSSRKEIVLLDGAGHLLPLREG